MKQLSYSDELIAEFSGNCDDMINSKFILADNKISNMLKTIASSGILYDLFSNVLSDFDFVSEFSKCKTPNSFNRISLRFPPEKKKFIAIVFTLLVEFDAKRRDLMRFLSEFYYSEDGINDSYITFVKSVIYTFKKYVLFLIDNDDEPPEEVREAEDFFNLSDTEKETEIKINQNELIELIENIRGIINSVSVETSLNVSEREELLIISEALYNAIMAKNDKLILIAWIGVKNSFKLKRLFDEKINNLGACLKQYWDI